MTTPPQVSSPGQEESEYAECAIDRDSDFNEAAALASQLPPQQRAGIHNWGLVIYRCTYASDSAWQHFLDVLDTMTRHSLRTYSHPELYNTLSWTIHSNPQALDGASKDFVRERFQEWVEREIANLQIAMDYRLTARWNQRFRYCIHVNEEVLESVVRDAPQPPLPDLQGVGYVNLIAKDWDEQEAKENDGEGEEEVDGKRMYDVGWMKVAVEGLAPRTYQLLGHGGGPFSDLYERPPTIAMP